MKRHPLVIYTAGATGLTANSMRKNMMVINIFCTSPQNLQQYFLLFIFLSEMAFGPKIKEIVIVADTLNCKCRGVFSVFWIIFKTRVGTILTGCLISEGIFYFYNWGFVPNSVIRVL